MVCILCVWYIIVVVELFYVRARYAKRASQPYRTDSDTFGFEVVYIAVNGGEIGEPATLHGPFVEKRFSASVRLGLR